MKFRTQNVIDIGNTPVEIGQIRYLNTADVFYYYDNKRKIKVLIQSLCGSEATVRILEPGFRNYTNMVLKYDISRFRG